MIIAWMAYCLLVSLLIGCAALAAEYGLCLYERTLRWVWAAAMLASLALPVAAYLLPTTSSLPPGPLWPVADAPIVESLLAVTPLSTAKTPGSALARINDVLLAAWLLSSILLLAFYARSYLRLRRARSDWAVREIGGRQVFQSVKLGPAVTGFFRGFIVVPPWVLDLDEDLRRLILLHEEEHLRAGDHRLLLAGLASLVLMPWNVSLWWHYRRMRLTVELDCDRRVLQSGARPRTYGGLLLEVGRQTSGLGFFPAAFSEPRSLLEKRVRNLIRRAPKRRREKAIVAGLITGVLFALACETPTPATERNAAGVDEATTLTGVVLDALSQAPLFGARAYLKGTGFGAVTADDGRYTLVDFPPGDYELVVELADYETFRLRFTVFDYEFRVTRGDTEFRFDGILELRHKLKPLSSAAPSPPIVPAPPLGQGPVFTPFTERPSIKDVRKAREIVKRSYPKLPKGAGIGGTVQIWVFIDADGKVRNTRIQKKSGRAELDAAAMSAVREFEFEPARNKGKKVPVWIVLPITFAVEG